MRTLKQFPEIETLKRRMQSLAVLDALICPEWEFRCFSFNGNWGVGETMGSIRNGLGDEVFALFSDVGCFIKEFNQEKEILDEAYSHVPVEFLDVVQEPAFDPANVTACYWRNRNSSHWEKSGKDGAFDPSASFLLALVDGNPETYESYANDYYERALPSGFVAQIFQHQALTSSDLDSISFERHLEELKKDIHEIGYPSTLP